MFKVTVPLFALIAVAAAALCTSCDPNDDSEAHLDKYFLRDVAAMQAMGLPVYWLGTEFTVDGHVFRGPYVSEFGAEVEEGGMQMDYVAAIDGANIGPTLTIYSRAAWELAKDRVTNPTTPGASRRTVSVLGKDAQMFLTPGGARPLNAMWLVVDLDEVVAVARTNSVVGATPSAGSDLNPFINNPDLLVQVMQGLRPYPE
jgi:hypothetical protein